MSLLKKIQEVIISGQPCLPIIEGGKGVSVTDGMSSGSFAATGAVGTFSGVFARDFDKYGDFKPIVYKGTTRKERHEELVDYSIKSGIKHAKLAHELSLGKGRIHINVLWEMGGSERILNGILEGAQGMVHGVTCGAGMPYNLGALAEKFKVYYYPIVSSMRAFRILWLRSYSKFSKWLGGVVYEDPWKAGGHNGLSNSEDPNQPQKPYGRVLEIRKFMNEVGLSEKPVVMAGGVWNLKEYEDWLDNPELGKICFQFGTRPILTTENPVPDEWKKELLNLKEGDVYLNNFSPTGFYSSAVNNDFIKELASRKDREIQYKTTEQDDFSFEIKIGYRGRKVFIKPQDEKKYKNCISQGYTEAMHTPSNTIIFVTPDKAKNILQDQKDCMGCLSHCKFSNWSTNKDKNYNTGNKPDPRSYCIQKTLQHISLHGDVQKNLMFAGHSVYRFAKDEMYKNNFIPTTKNLVEALLDGR